MKRLDFNQLTTFIAIVDAGSITKAAVLLHRTQAAISIQLRKLEEGLGKQLFNRSYNNFTLTREGEVLLSYARKILSLSEEAFNAVNDDEISGVVRFGIPDGYARAFIQHSLRQFIQRYPKVRIQIKNDNSHNLYKSLRAGKLDLILATKDPKEAGGMLVRREKVQWVAAKGYQVNEQEPIPLALYSRGCAYRNRIVEQLNQSKKDWFVAFECQGVTGFDIAITNGLAISAVAASLVKKEWQVIPNSSILPELNDVEIELHTSPTELSDAISCFSAELTAQITNIKTI